MNKFKIGDNVNFVKGRMMYSGKITKFYKNYHNREECSVATEVGTFPHILLQKVAKIKDSSFVDEKDKQIADLEAKLADRTEQLKIALKDFNDIQKENDKLAQQLAEKDELLKQKIGDMKSTDFIKMCIKSGYVVEAKENDNQKAIEEIEKIKKEINLRPVVVRNCGYGDFEEILLEDVYDVIDNQIKQLKEMK